MTGQYICALISAGKVEQEMFLKTRGAESRWICTVGMVGRPSNDDALVFSHAGSKFWERVDDHHFIVVVSTSECFRDRRWSRFRPQTGRAFRSLRGLE